MSDEKDQFTLEKLQIHDRLLEVEKNQAAFKMIQADCHSKICAIHDLLMGNGSADNPGVVIRIDRIEQQAIARTEERRKEERRKTAHRNIVYASIAAVGMPQIWTILRVLIGK